MFWRCEQTAWYFKRHSSISLALSIFSLFFLFSLPFFKPISPPSSDLTLTHPSPPSSRGTFIIHFPIPWHFQPKSLYCTEYQGNMNTAGHSVPTLWCHHCGPHLLRDCTRGVTLKSAFPTSDRAAGVNNEQTWSSADKAVHHGMRRIQMITKDMQNQTSDLVARLGCALRMYIAEWFNTGPGYCGPGRKGQLTVAPPRPKIKPPAHLFSLVIQDYSL